MAFGLSRYPGFHPAAWKAKKESERSQSEDKSQEVFCVAEFPLWVKRNFKCLKVV